MFKSYFPLMLIFTVACGKASNKFPELPLVNSKKQASGQSNSSKHSPFILTAPVSTKANLKNSQNKSLEVQLTGNNPEDLKENYRKYMNSLYSEKKENELLKLAQSIPLFQITEEAFFNFQMQLQSIYKLRTTLINDTVVIKSNDLKKFCGYKVSLYNPENRQFLDINNISDKNCREGLIELSNLNVLFKGSNTSPLILLRKVDIIGKSGVIFDGENSYFNGSNLENIENLDAFLRTVDENSMVQNNKIERLFDLYSNDEMYLWNYQIIGGYLFATYQNKQTHLDKEKAIKEFNLSYAGEVSSLDLKSQFEVDLLEEFTLVMSNFSYMKFNVKTQEPNFGTSNVRHRRIEFNPAQFDVAEFLKQGFYLNLHDFNSKRSEQAIVYNYVDGEKNDVNRIIVKIKINMNQLSKPAMNLMVGPNHPYQIYESQKWVGYWEDAGEILTYADHVSFDLRIEQK